MLQLYYCYVSGINKGDLALSVVGTIEDGTLTVLNETDDLIWPSNLCKTHS